MEFAFETRALSKRFGATPALAEITLAVEPGAIVGLVGRNGSGKTTLLRHLVGLYLPSAGACLILGTPSGRLAADELSRIGVVQQPGQLLGWMTVAQHLAYVASFYPRWDAALAARLQEELELDPRARVATLSPGNAQKLALLLAVCHRPELLLLDEPASALDPIARASLLRLLLERLREDGLTLVVSSHLLRDLEAIVDQVVCLEGGRLVAHASLDDLAERYGEWRAVAGAIPLPARFDEPFVLEQESDGRQARLLVRAGEAEAEAFRARHGATLHRQPLNLERIFPLLVREAKR
jgi:ABC-2 type transport system ATP-binding protein